MEKFTCWGKKKEEKTRKKKKKKTTNTQGPYTIGNEKNGNHLSKCFREVVLTIKNL
jgi:hypothetical protein